MKKEKLLPGVSQKRLLEEAKRGAISVYHLWSHLDNHDAWKRWADSGDNAIDAHNAALEALDAVYIDPTDSTMLDAVRAAARAARAACCVKKTDKLRKKRFGKSKN